MGTETVRNFRGRFSPAATAAKIESFEDARLLSKRRLPPFLAQLYENGLDSALTLSDCRDAYDQVKFVPRAAVSYPQRSLSTTLFGQELKMPLVLSPVGMLRMGAPSEGEVGAARAAGAAGVGFGVSSFMGYPIEDIVAAGSAPIYFQLFLLGGREGAEAMIKRARAAGCSALLVTVDIAAPATGRDRPYNQRVHIPQGRGILDALRVLPQIPAHVPWWRAFAADGWPDRIPMVLDDQGNPVQILDGVAHQLDRIPVWDDLAWIREAWDGPIALKGILHVDDAIRAREIGVDAIVVSNHGGNHLDGGVPSLEALPAIAAAVGDDLEIIVDGGVQRGSDVVKALALGADCVGIGRAYVYALMAAGEAGVAKMLQLFGVGIENTLASIGCPSLDALDATYVRVPASFR